MKKHDFSELAKTHKSVRMRLRYSALAHFQEGCSRNDIAKFLKVSRTSVNKWISQYHQNGLAGLVDKKTTVRPFRLSESQSLQLIEYINEYTKNEKGGRLVGADIQLFISEHFGHQYHLSSVYKLLHRLGFSWITSRSKHPKQALEIQEDFKKFQIKTILKIPGHISLDKVDIRLQDEARFGQQNTTTKLWAKTGSRPLAVKQQQFEYAYLFGSVCVTNGQSQAMVMPYVNKDIMYAHLKQISMSTAEDRHAIIIMDGAGWHTEDLAIDINNVSVIKLPPYSQELNPIEQVWSWLRQHHLANRCFNGYESIVDAVCDAWNDFVSDSQRVIKMCTRGWMNLNN